MQEVELNQPKKLIITVGKQACGKSSFVKMLTIQQDKHKIKATDNATSGTSQATVYRVDPEYNLNEEDLYIMDTPGIDTKEMAYILIQKIEMIIIEQMYEIVSIIFFVESNNGRPVREILQFCQRFKIKYCFKQAIMYCVLTKFDTHSSKQEQQIKEDEQNMGQQFINNNLSFLWEKRFWWISEPAEIKKKERFNNVVSKEKMSQYFRHTQWIQLKARLVNIIGQKQYQLYSHYIKDYMDFYRSMIANIELNLQEKISSHSSIILQIQVKKETQIFTLTNLNKTILNLPIPLQALLIVFGPLYVLLFSLAHIVQIIKKSKWYTNFNDTYNSICRIKAQSYIRYIIQQRIKKINARNVKQFQSQFNNWCGNWCTIQIITKQPDDSQYRTYKLKVKTDAPSPEAINLLQHQITNKLYNQINI